MESEQSFGNKRYALMVSRFEYYVVDLLRYAYGNKGSLSFVATHPYTAGMQLSDTVIKNSTKIMEYDDFNEVIEAYPEEFI